MGKNFFIVGIVYDIQLHHEVVTLLALEELKAKSEHLLGCYKQ